MENLCYTSYCYISFLSIHQRPAEIIDEEEDGEKESKGTEKKEEFTGMNGEVEEEGGGETTAASEQAEMPGHTEEQAGPARVNGGTDEENGEELEQVNNELQEAVDEETKSPGAGNGQEEVFLLLLLTVCTHECVCLCVYAHT